MQALLDVTLFGSAARGGATKASDLDVCLVVSPDAAEQKIEKRLKYLGELHLDVHVFQGLPLPIRRRVLKEGRVRLVKDEDALYALATRIAKEFEEVRHVHEAYLEAGARG